MPLLSVRVVSTALWLVVSSLVGWNPSRVSAQPKSSVQVKLVRARLVPFTTADGQRTMMLLVDWKNVGKKPVTKVYADIEFFNSNGLRREDSDRHYTIFYASTASGAVKPGKTYIEKVPNGYVAIPGFGNVAKAKVRIAGAQ